MNIETAVYHLLKTEPFYANLLLNTKRIFTKDIPTAGVNITNNVNLYINPDFFGSLSLLAQVDVLKHEMLHIMNNHFDRYAKVKDDKYKMMQNFNIAADLAINEHLPNLPDTISVAGKEGQTAKVKLLKQRIPTAQEKMHAEYYFDLLKEDAEKNGGAGKEGMECVDDHELWSQGEQNKEVRDQMVRQALKKAAESTKNAGGHIPECVESLIATLGQSTVNWKSQLHSFVQNAIDTKIISTRKKRNRRYGIMYPGSKVEEVIHLGLAVDTSGSISDKDVEQFYTEIHAIHKLGIQITVMEADSEVRAEYAFDPKKAIKPKGRGGTLYSPALKRAEELKLDACVYLGDGDIFDESIYKPKVPVLWAMTNQNKPPATWGRSLQIKVL